MLFGDSLKELNATMTGLSQSGVPVAFPPELIAILSQFSHSVGNISQNGIPVDTGSIQRSALTTVLVIILFLYLCMVLPSTTDIIAMFTMLFAAYGGIEACTNFVSSHMPDLTVIRAFFVKYTPWIDSPIEAHEEAGNSIPYETIFFPFTKVMTALFAFCGMAGDPRKLPPLIKMGQLSTSVLQLRNLSDFINESFKSSKEYFYSHIFGIAPEVEPDDYAVRVDKWFGLCKSTVGNNEWVQQSYEGKDHIDEIRRLQELGQDLLVMAGSGNNRAFVVPIREQMVVLKDTLKGLEVLLSPTTQRPEPVFLCFYGGTGVGKTYLSKQLMTDVLRCCPAEIRARAGNQSDLYFSKAFSSDYMDGYSGQFCLFLDELFQSTDATVRSEQLSTLFQIINPFGATLNMAAANLKNKFKFCSPLVIGTTNLQCWDGLPLACVEALQRRRDFYLEPVVSAQFANENGSLNVPRWESYCQHMGLDPNIPNYCCFYVCDASGSVDRVAGVRYTYAEVVEMVAEKIRYKHNLFYKQSTTLVSNFARFKEELREDIALGRDSSLLLKERLPPAPPSNFEFCPFQSTVKSSRRGNRMKRSSEPRYKYDYGINPENMDPLYKETQCYFYPPPHQYRIPPPSTSFYPQPHEQAGDDVEMHNLLGPDPYVSYSATSNIIRGRPADRDFFRPNLGMTFDTQIQEAARRIHSPRVGMVNRNVPEDSWLANFFPMDVIQTLSDNDKKVCVVLLHQTMPWQNDKRDALFRKFCGATNLVVEIPENVEELLKDSAVRCDYYGKFQACWATLKEGFPIYTVLKYLGMLLASGLVTYIFFRIFRCIFGDGKRDNVQPESRLYGRPNWSSKMKHFFTPNVAREDEVSTGVMQSDPSPMNEDMVAFGKNAEICKHGLPDPIVQAVYDIQAESLAAIIVSQTYVAKLLDSDGVVLTTARALCFRGGFFLVNKHFLYCDNSLKVGADTIKLIGPRITFSFDVKQCQFEEIGNRHEYDDVVVVYSGKAGQPTGRDIIKHFIRYKDVSKFDDCYGELLLRRPDEITNVVRMFSMLRPAPKAFMKKENPVKTSGNTTLFAKCGVCYSIPTKLGDCGSPVMVHEPKLSQKILGIHCSGGHQSSESITGLTSFGTFVDGDFLQEKVLKILGHKPPEAQSLVMRAPIVSIPDVLKDKNIHIVGFVPTVEQTRLPTGGTKIEPSIFQLNGMYEPQTRPADCQYFGVDSDIDYSLSKFRQTNVVVDRELVEKVQRWMALTYFSDPARDRTIVPIKDTLNIVDDSDEHMGVNMHASLGPPWSRSGFKRSDVIEYDPIVCKYVFKPGVGFDYLRSVEKIDVSISKGLIPDLPQILYLKGNERLKDQKDSEGNITKKKHTRTFFACAFAFVMVFRRYFGAFIKYIRATRHIHGMAIGLDPHTEWDTMAQSLEALDVNVLNADYQNFDRTIPVEFTTLFFGIAKMYYSDTHNLARETIEIMILDPVIHYTYVAFKAHLFNSSGNPGTGEINGFSNYGKSLYVLLKLGFSMIDLGRFRQFSMGDDMIAASSLNICAKAFYDEERRLGFVPTSADKVSEPGSIPLKDAKWCNRDFHKEHGRYIGGLDLDTINEMLLWKQKGMSNQEALEQTVRCAVIEYDHHPIDKVRSNYRLLFDFCSRFHIPLSLSERFVQAMFTSSPGSYDVCTEADYNLIQKIVIQIGQIFWAHQTKEVYPYRGELGVLGSEDPKSWPCKIVVYDIGKRLWCGFPKSTICHVGFRGLYKGVQVEISYGHQGVVWTRADYTPDEILPVEGDYYLDMARVSTVLNGFKLPYSAVFRNCQSFVDTVQRYNGEVLRVFYPPFIKWLRETHPEEISKRSVYWVEPEQQADTESVGVDAINRQALGADVDDVVMSDSVPPPIPIQGVTRQIGTLLKSAAQVGSYQWSTTQPNGHQLFALEVPGDLFKIPQFSKKIAFNYLLKCGIELEVKLSSVSYNCGMVIVYFIPQASYGFPGGRKYHWMTMSSRDKIELDASRSNYGTMRIPFVNKANYLSAYGPESPHNSLGTVYGIVFNKLRTEAVLQHVNLIVTANFVDVTLEVPTPLTSISEWATNSFESIYPRYEPQQQADDEAHAKSSQGLISGIATNVAGVARLVAGIPVFSGPASVISTIANGVSDIAQFLGMSKPVSQQATVPVIPQPFSGACAMEGLDMGQLCGLSPTNCVDIAPSRFSKNVDEMSISYIVRTPTITIQGTWDASDAPGKTIMQFPVHPYVSSSGVMKYNDIDRTYLIMSHMGYVATAFNYWRGGIQCEIDVKGTEHHKGILIIAFIPGGTVSDDKPFDLETTTTIQLDLDSSSKVRFVIPWVSKYMYHRTGYPFDEMRLDGTTATGTVVIKVFNTLSATTILPTKIEFNIAFAAAPDFELNLPSLVNMNGFGYGFENVVIPQKQSDDEFSVSPGDWRFSSPAPPFAGVDVPMFDANSLVMGERVLSVRNVVKMHCFDFSVNTGVGNLMIKGNKHLLVPFHSFTNETDVATKLGRRNHTMIDHFGRLFRYSAGKKRCKIAVTSGDFHLSASPDLHIDIPTFTWLHTDRAEESVFVKALAKLNPTLEFTLPYYNHARSNIHGHDDSDMKLRLLIRPLVCESEEQTVFLEGYSAVGDDYTLGQLMPAPCLYELLDLVAPFLDALNDVVDRGRGVLKPDGGYNVQAVKPATYMKVIWGGGKPDTTLFCLAQKIYYGKWLDDHYNRSMVHHITGKVSDVLQYDPRELIRKESYNEPDCDYYMCVNPIWDVGSADPHISVDTGSCSLEVNHNGRGKGSPLQYILRMIWLYVEVKHRVLRIFPITKFARGHPSDDPNHPIKVGGVDVLNFVMDYLVPVKIEGRLHVLYSAPIPPSSASSLSREITDDTPCPLFSDDSYEAV